MAHKLLKVPDFVIFRLVFIPAVAISSQPHKMQSSYCAVHQSTSSGGTVMNRLDLFTKESQNSSQQQPAKM